MDVWKTIARHSYGVILLENCLRQSSVTGLGREWGINGRYRSTECLDMQRFYGCVLRDQGALANKRGSSAPLLAAKEQRTLVGLFDPSANLNLSYCSSCISSS